MASAARARVCAGWREEFAGLSDLGFGGKQSWRITMKRIASQIMAFGLSFLLCVSADAQQAVTQSIVTDGKTNTTVKTTGKTTTITTSTVQGSVGYNSFSTFNVAKGNTVDLI